MTVEQASALSQRSALASATASATKYARVVLVFWFLMLLLWSTLLRPGIELDVRWVPKSFFSSAKLTTCIIRMHHKPLAPLEAMCFAAVAMLGYFRGCGGAAGVERTIYGCTLTSFERAMMGVRQKYYWMCFVPWIITFAQNWLHNVAEFLLLFSGHDVYEAHNIYSAMLLLLVYFLVQALLASEVVYMALHGWCAMRNINDENVEWERKKRIFNDDTLETVFGQAN